ncbi:MAG: hypothetical protein ACM359_13300 [Bacillota bacterium]
MTLQQKCEELIRDFLGSDAATLPAKRSQLVSNLVALLEESKKKREPHRTAGKAASHEQAA